MNVAYYSKKPEEIFNIIVMDWTSLSTVPLTRYPDAAKATKLAGNYFNAHWLQNAINTFGWVISSCCGYFVIIIHLVGLAGKDLSEFIFKLLQSGNLRSLEDIQLLGHSLGAHVAGVAGNRIQGIDEKYIIERITGYFLYSFNLVLVSPTRFIQPANQLLGFLP